MVMTNAIVLFGMIGTFAIVGLFVGCLELSVWGFLMGFFTIGSIIREGVFFDVTVLSVILVSIYFAFQVLDVVFGAEKGGTSSGGVTGKDA